MTPLQKVGSKKRSIYKLFSKGTELINSMIQQRVTFIFYFLFLNAFAEIKDFFNGFEIMGEVPVVKMDGEFHNRWVFVFFLENKKYSSPTYI